MENACTPRGLFLYTPHNRDARTDILACTDFL